MAAGLVGTAGLSRAFGFLVRDAAKFESAMAQVNTIAGVSTDRMALLTNQVSALAARMPKSREDLGYGLYQVFSAGITDSAEAMRVLEVSTRLAVGGVVETADAVKAVTGILNAYNLEASAAGDISDILFQTVRLGVTTIPELATTLGQVIPTAAQADVAVEELGAAIATLTKANIPTAIAATALNSMLASLIKPGEEATRTARDLGIEWSLAAMQGMGFADFMSHVTEAADGNVEVLAKLSGSMRSARALMVLAGKGADNFEMALEGMEDRMGSTDDAAAKMSGTLENQALILKNKAAEAWGAFAASVTKAAVALGSLVFPDDDKLARLAAMGSGAPAVERYRERQTAAFIGRRHRPAGFASDASLAAARRREAAVGEASAQAAARAASSAKQELDTREAIRKSMEAAAKVIVRIRTGQQRLNDQADALRKAYAEVEVLKPADPELVTAPITHLADRTKAAAEQLAKASVSVAEIADGVGHIAKGLLNAADAAGLLNDDLRRVLRGVIDIADAWKSIGALRDAGGSLMSLQGIGALTGAVERSRA